MVVVMSHARPLVFARHVEQRGPARLRSPLALCQWIEASLRIALIPHDQKTNGAIVADRAFREVVGGEGFEHPTPAMSRSG